MKYLSIYLLYKECSPYCIPVYFLDQFSALCRLLWGLLFSRESIYSLKTTLLFTRAGTSYGPVSVCLSVTSRCSVETDGRINLFFGMGASFDPVF